ncbi:TVP38/TMEM64 family protein [Deinococcus sonorensis]|uniref:TVP38/TMEM64 family membrane protein n=2 Tax=Deinococcus sonorensis TaxID=309891 RepID=A0AAU7U536_9DEIO
MKLYLFLAFGLLLLLGAVFVVVEALGVPLLTDPTPWLRMGGVTGALVGTALLVADVLLPVPSSVVMVGYGSLYGVLIGTLLSLLGSVGAAMFGFLLGRRGGVWLTRFFPGDARQQAERVLGRYGLLAITVTRPVPLLAETLVVLAGTARLPAWQVALASALGSLPAALLYAVAGATAARTSWLWMIVVLIVSTALMWLVGRLLERRLVRTG